MAASRNKNSFYINKQKIKYCIIMKKTVKAITLNSALILAFLVSLPGTAAASDKEPVREWQAANEHGWFWGERQKWEEEQKRIKEENALKQLAKKEQEEKEKEKDCTNPDEWDVTCGFVYPDRDFDFSQKQLAELTKQLAMYPDDVKKVEQYQRFVHWAVDQAATAAGSAEWNIVQNQDMNPFIDNPISAFGRRAAGMEIMKNNKTVFEDIVDQGGMLVFFTRHDCVYCHKAYPLIRILSDRSGIPLHNASLDGKCLDGFDSEHCYAGEDVVLSAQALQVAMVPDLFLFLPKDRGWVRISSGLETLDVMESRVLVFFGAAKKATKKGIERVAGSQQPAVDFTSSDIYERAQKAIGVAVGSSKNLEVKNEE